MAASNEQLDQLATTIAQTLDARAREHTGGNPTQVSHDDVRAIAHAVHNAGWTPDQPDADTTDE